MNLSCKLSTVVVLTMLLMPMTQAASLTAQNGGALAVSGFGGFSNEPGGFDVFRQTTFDSGLHYGAALAFRLSPGIAVRGEFASSSSSGQETGAVNETVDFDRTYYGMTVEARFPRGVVTPYVLGGGGFVTVHRQAPSLTYEFTELAGRAGAGISFPFSAFPLEAFGELSQWFYPRATTGEGVQRDTNLSVGLSLLAF